MLTMSILLILGNFFGMEIINFNQIYRFSFLFIVGCVNFMKKK